MPLQSLSRPDPLALVQFILAVVVAFAAALPIGPVSILAVQRGITHGFWRAFWPTLGAVFADVIFGVIAALGAGQLSSAIMESKQLFRLAGGVLLAAAGFFLFAYKGTGRGDAAPKSSFGLHHLGLLNFTLVLSNPMTLGFYLAAFTLVGLKSPRLASVETAALGAGIAFGALAWFSSICVLAGRFHMKVSDAALHRVRAGVGIFFMMTGVASMILAVLSG